MKNNPFENFKNLGTLKSDTDEYEHPNENEPGEILDEEVKKPNFSIIYLISFVVIAIFFFKLLNLQVVQGTKYQYLAEGNRIRTRDIQAPRGIIYDSSGLMLSRNVAKFNLEIYPAELPEDKKTRLEIYQKIQEVSQIPMEETERKIESEGLFSVDPIVLKENLSNDEALLLKIKYRDSSGVAVSALPNREYETIPGLSHILGYIGKINDKELSSNSNYDINSVIGKTGIEQSYESILKGQTGKEQIEVDSKGRIQRSLASLDPIPGNNLYLSINAELQKKVSQALDAKLKELNLSSGVVVALDPQNGNVLSMVSLPSYDDNLFTKNISDEEYQKLLNDPNKPMVDRAISGNYPSGSIIKPIFASAALQEKVISEYTTINDTGQIQVGDYIYPDWKAHGMTDVRKALAESCDVFFYAAGGGWDKIKGLGADSMDKYLDIFGFGKKTGIDIPGEGIGLIPTPDWKKRVKKEPWYLGDSYHLAIGQGDFLTTPLQIADAIAAIANGGELLKPHFAIKETDYQGKVIKEFDKEVVKKDFIDSYNLQVVREGMRQGVISGSSRSLNDLPVEVAGKTGTAQFGNEDKTHAWFVSFAPYNNPKIVLVVLLEAGGEGSSNAVPVAKEILNWYFNQPQNQ